MPDTVNILLVDDQPSNLLSYEAVLGGLGAHLLKANSATEALECLLRHDVAVILVDVCMPGLGGYGLASLIREHPRSRRASIMFVSATRLTDRDRLRGYQCGAVDYVPVPIVPELLRAKVSVFAELYRKTRALERLNNELEARVQERTTALEVSTAQLREAGRRKDEFLAVLAHELRNPLAPIRTAAQLLRLPGLSDGQRSEAREIIDRQVGHMVRLIDDLMDVSRITTGSIPLVRTSVALDALLTEAVELTRKRAIEAELELHLTVSQRDVLVQGDAMRLLQVFGNLLHNAVKFTPSGGRVHVTLECQDGWATITIGDSGLGMPTEFLPIAFGLFTQVEPRRGGLGVGLSLARRLIELHEGTVAASSDGPGLGTTLTVRLPLRQAEPAAVAGGTTPPCPRDPEVRRVLVADDNHDAADTLATHLRLQGHDVHVVYDGDEALAEAGRFAPEVVLLDLGMPKMDGCDAAREIRRQAQDRPMVIVAVTGWGQPQDYRRTKLAGFDAHLVKPVDERSLTHLLATRFDSPEPGPVVQQDLRGA